MPYEIYLILSLSKDARSYCSEPMDAIAAERQLKGWRRAKKEALIRGDFAALRELSKPYEVHCNPSLRPSTSSG
jgi:hypothetical protein